MGGMMHCGGEAQIAAQGTASPACGSRGMSCDFAVLHAFGCRELEKNQTSRMVAVVDMRFTIMHECFPVP